MKKKAALRRPRVPLRPPGEPAQPAPPPAALTVGDEAHRDELIRALTAEVAELRRRLSRLDQLHLDRLHEGEPVYLIRAQDLHAPAVIRYWAELALHRGTPATKVASARLVANSMDLWQSANATKVKAPD